MDCFLQAYGINVNCVGAHGGVKSGSKIGVGRSRNIWQGIVLGEHGWACEALLGAKCAWLPRAQAMSLCELRARAHCWAELIMSRGKKEIKKEIPYNEVF